MTKSPSESTLSDSTDAHLGLWDAVSIIVGIVVGTAIFKAPPTVFGGVWGPWQALGCWALGGMLALVGSLCYAELATTYPRLGGDYVYLTRAFGRPFGFLFGWAQLAAILTGSIGAMAYAFGDYAVALFDLVPEATEDLAANAVRELERTRLQWTAWFAVGSVAVLTVLNLLGVVFGKAVQNILTVVKVVGLCAIVIAGYGWGGDASMAGAEPPKYLGFGLSMVLVLYAYGGWNDAAFVAAEVRNRSRNIPMALILGVTGILLIYLLVNGAYLWGLGFVGVRESNAPAADVLQMAWGNWGGKGMSLLVMLSALGAINGMIFTGARVYVSLGSDHRVFAWLGRWSGRGSAPVGALLAQSTFALLLILLVGTNAGRTQMDAALTNMGFQPLPGEETLGGFDTLVAATAPVFWVFFLLTGISLFVLRFKDRDRVRPFSAPLYPLEPTLFCGMCVFMLYSALAYAKQLSLLGIVPLLIGIPLYLISQAASRKNNSGSA